jgi:MFS family permease
MTEARPADRQPSPQQSHGTRGDVTSQGEHPPTRLPLLALLAANAVSLIGSMLTVVALPWFVLQTTGSPAKTGLTGFFVVLPHFVSGVFGGTIVDRLGFKRTSVAADLVSALGIVLIPLLHVTVGLAFWQLLGLVFLGSLLEIPGLTARRSLLPELAALARQPLERANAGYEGNQYLSLLLGPPLAGVLVSWIGAANVLWLDAATFAVSALVVALAIPSAAVQAARRKSGRYWAELLEGLRFLRGDRLLSALAISLAITNCLGTPFLGVLLPVYVKETFGDASDLGLLIAAYGGGSVLGAIVFAAIGHRLPRRATWIGAYCLVPLQFWVLALDPSLPVAAVFILVGITGGPLNPLLVTIRHERIPLELRGRVFSTFSAISTVAAPLGMILQGNLIEGIGLHETILALAVTYQIVGLGMLFVPALRAMDRPPAAAGQAAKNARSSV